MLGVIARVTLKAISREGTDAGGVGWLCVSGGGCSGDSVGSGRLIDARGDDGNFGDNGADLAVGDAVCATFIRDTGEGISNILYGSTAPVAVAAARL